MLKDRIIFWLPIFFSLVTGHISFVRAQIPFRYSVIDDSAGSGGCDVKTTGDINGDGFQDVIIAAKGGGEVIWYANPGLIKNEIYKANFRWSTDAEVGDMEGDGDNDIVIVSWYDQRHYWLENPRSNGTWKLHLIGNGMKGHDVEIADLDGDGDLDVITRSETWGKKDDITSAKEIQIWRQEGPDSWTRATLYTIEGGGIRAADVDNDGDADIIACGRWFENKGDDIIKNPWPEHVFDANSTIYNKIEFVDINADGRRDIIMVPSESHATIPERGPVVWYEGPLDPKNDFWRKHIVAKDMGDLHSLDVADMDNDGDLDIFTAEMHNSVDPDEVIVYINDGKGLAWTKQVVATTGSHEAGIFDYQNDGDYDIVGINYNSNKLEMWENKTDPLRTVLADGLVGYWNFDETEGNVATDRSGNRHNGMISGAVWNVGKKGNALKFDSLDDKVEIPDHKQLRIKDDITIAAWIFKNRLNKSERWDAIVTKVAGKWNYELLISKDKSDQLAFYSPTTTPKEVYSEFPIPGNLWQHVAVTRSTNDVNFYINGVKVSSVKMSGSFPTTAGSLLIGFDGKSTNGMDGLIDEVFIYDRCLSENEIKALLFTGGIPR